MHNTKNIHVLISSLFLLALLSGCDRKGSESQQSAAHAEESHGDHEGEEHGDGEAGEVSVSSEGKSLIGLSLVTAENRLFSPQYPLTGRIAAPRDRLLQLIPRHGGILVRVPYGMGAKVKPGDTLAVLRNPETLVDYVELSTQHGTVIDQQAAVGELAAGVVLTVADLSMVWLEVAVPERIHLGPAKGLRGTLVQEPGRPEAAIGFSIDYVSPVLDPDTRTQVVRATLDNRAGTWKPGQLRKVMIQGSSAVRSVAVPSEAVQTWNGTRILFFPENDTTFAARQVQVGREQDGWTEILSGVAEGESVVGPGGFELKSKLATANMGDGHNH